MNFAKTIVNALINNFSQFSFEHMKVYGQVHLQYTCSYAKLLM